jgi:predicted lipid-binding transport protein (Tim44 family)
MDRTVTPRGTYGGPSWGAPGAGMASSGSFGRGLMGGLAGGLLGAGLFGLLTGHGFFGGMGGFMSLIGLLLQIALLVFLARLAFNWFAGRNGAAAGAAGRPGASMFAGGSAFGRRAGFGPGFGGGGAASPGPSGSQGAPIRPTKEDFDAFERLLGETQAAYSREDGAGLRRLATPEMVRYLEEELATNRAKGVVNRISDVKLLQGDLSEAWREGADEYATVAMRFALADVTEDRATGKVVSGSATQPTQSTEVWTFRRPAGAGPEAWKLSAIQHTA